MRHALRVAVGGVAVILVTVLSIVFFLILAPLAVLCVVASFIAEVSGRVRKYTGVEGASLTWLVLVVPTFVIMPLLIASRLHLRIPFGVNLAIFAGITLSAIYDFFVPTPSLWDWDHPFPPLTRADLVVLALTASMLSLAPAYALHWVRMRRARSRAAEQRIPPEPAHPA